LLDSPDGPSSSTIHKKVMETMKLVNQIVAVEMPAHMPRTCSG